ncbi:hypothetical protein B0H14DRAFT_3491544 [Mycena olivaceomarginata]|nr:hypothetical protein B0H14DRAFT_3491544 [Mycena olivaceomarginata]
MRFDCGYTPSTSPPNLVLATILYLHRLIAAYHLCIVDANSPAPGTLIRTPQSSTSRPASTPSGSKDIATSRHATRTRWRTSFEHHDFWNTAVQIYDPHNGYAYFGWVAAPAPANSNNPFSAAAPRGEELLRTLCASSHAPGVFAPADGVVKGAVSAFIELDEGSVNNAPPGVDPNDRYTNDVNAAYARANYTTTHSHSSPTGYYDDYDESELGSEARTAISMRMMTRTIWMGTGSCAGNVGEGDGAWGLGAREDIGWALEHPELGIRTLHPVSRSISPSLSPPHPFTASFALPTPAARALAPATPGCHPGPSTPLPPVYALAEAAHNAHVKNMRTVLLPVFKNLAGLSASRKPLDPAMRAARMSLGRRGACEEPERIRIRSASGRRRTKTPRGGERRLGCGDERYEPRALDVDIRDDAESAPAWEREHEERQRKEKRAAARVDLTLEEREIKPTISVSPVPNSPRLLRPNPYIPETIAHLLPYSLDAIKMVWREACAPLYHCRCTVCEHAMVAQQAAQDGNVEEDQGPGAWEREMELVDKMANGRLKTPYRGEGGVSDEPEIAYGGDDRLRQYLPLYAFRALAFPDNNLPSLSSLPPPLAFPGPPHSPSYNSFGTPAESASTIVPTSPKMQHSPSQSDSSAYSSGSSRGGRHSTTHSQAGSHASHASSASSSSYASYDNSYASSNTSTSIKKWRPLGNTGAKG